MTNHSGGAHGSDRIFEQECEKYGIETISYSFVGHHSKSKNRKVLTQEELNEGFKHVQISNKTLKRNIFNLSKYVKDLLSRNWYQVINSDSVFAIGEIDSNHHVKGGTGWAVQMAIDNKNLHDGRNIYVFDQTQNSWFAQLFSIKTDYWEWNKIDGTPKLTENFAGIGTRNINENGINAIKKLLKINLEKKNEC